MREREREGEGEREIEVSVQEKPVWGERGKVSKVPVREI